MKEREFIKEFCLNNIELLSESKRRKLDGCISYIDELLNRNIKIGGEKNENNWLC